MSTDPAADATGRKLLAGTADANAGTGADVSAQWQELVDTESGRTYYHNTATGEVAWYKPGWSRLVDPTSGQVFYYNSHEDRSVFTPPPEYHTPAAHGTGADGDGQPTEPALDSTPQATPRTPTSHEGSTTSNRRSGEGSTVGGRDHRLPPAAAAAVFAPESRSARALVSPTSFAGVRLGSTPGSSGSGLRNAVRSFDDVQRVVAHMAARMERMETAMTVLVRDNRSLRRNLASHAARLERCQADIARSRGQHVARFSVSVQTSPSHGSVRSTSPRSMAHSPIRARPARQPAAATGQHGSGRPRSSPTHTRASPASATRRRRSPSGSPPNSTGLGRRSPRGEPTQNNPSGSPSTSTGLGRRSPRGEPTQNNPSGSPPNSTGRGRRSPRAVLTQQHLARARRAAEPTRSREPRTIDQAEDGVAFALKQAMQRFMFAVLSDDQKESFLPHLRGYTYEAGDRVVEQGTVPPGVFVVASGSVDIVNDRERVGVMLPGQHFAELSVLYNAAASYSAIALEESELWLLPADMYRACAASRAHTVASRAPTPSTTRTSSRASHSGGDSARPLPARQSPPTLSDGRGDARGVKRALAPRVRSPPPPAVVTNPRGGGSATTPMPASWVASSRAHAHLVPVSAVASPGGYGQASPVSLGSLPTTPYSARWKDAADGTDPAVASPHDSRGSADADVDTQASCGGASAEKHAPPPRAQPQANRATSHAAASGGAGGAGSPVASVAAPHPVPAKESPSGRLSPSHLSPPPSPTPCAKQTHALAAAPTPDAVLAFLDGRNVSTAQVAQLATWLRAHVSLLRHIPHQYVLDAANTMEAQRLDPGTCVLRPGKPADRLVVVCSGRLVYQGGIDGAQDLDDLTAGAFCGHTVLLPEPTPEPLTVVASEATVCLCLSPAAVESVWEPVLSVMLIDAQLRHEHLQRLRDEGGHQRVLHAGTTGVQSTPSAWRGKGGDRGPALSAHPQPARRANSPHDAAASRTGDHGAGGSIEPAIGRGVPVDSECPTPAPATVDLAELTVLATLAESPPTVVELVQLHDTVCVSKRWSKARVVAASMQSHVLRERRLLSQLRHPFIVDLIATGQDEANACLLLEYVPGGELWRLLYGSVPEGGAGTPLPADAVQFYVACVVEVLRYMHKVGVAYRDLKPENLLIGRDGYIKLVDCGFSKSIPWVERGMGGTETVHKKSHTLLGSPEYLAPELILFKGHGKEVDLWALGALLYELFVGVPPFHEDTPKKTFDRAVRAAFKFPKGFVSRHPHAADLIRQLLQTKPRRRLGAEAGGQGRKRGGAGATGTKKQQQGGMAALMSHPFFRSISWPALVRKMVTPPHLPSLISSDKADTTCYSRSMERSRKAAAALEAEVVEAARKSSRPASIPARDQPISAGDDDAFFSEF